MYKYVCYALGMCTCVLSLRFHNLQVRLDDVLTDWCIDRHACAGTKIHTFLSYEYKTNAIPRRLTPSTPPSQQMLTPALTPAPQNHSEHNSWPSPSP